MSKGYVFQPSFFELLETFKRPADRDALNMAIHRFMFKGEEPTFTNMELKRAWIGLYPYLSKSRKTSITMSKETSNNLRTISEETSDNLPRNFEDTSKILARNSEDTSKKLLSRDKDKEKDIDITPKSPKGVSADFEKFWEVYPKRVEKQKAIRAFERAKKVWTKDGKDINYILNAVEKAKTSEQWLKDNGKFIPYPTSWLNAGRWDDEEKLFEEPEVKKQKPVPYVAECPKCHSYDIIRTLDRVICRSCGAFHDYNHTKGKWEKA